MVHQEGFVPQYAHSTTFRFRLNARSAEQGHRNLPQANYALSGSNRSLNPPNKKTGNKASLLFGTPGGIRTPDLLFRRQALYPAELLVHEEYVNRTKRIS